MRSRESDGCCHFLVNDPCYQTTGLDKEPGGPRCKMAASVACAMHAQWGVRDTSTYRKRTRQDAKQGEGGGASEGGVGPLSGHGLQVGPAGSRSGSALPAFGRACPRFQF